MAPPAYTKRLLAGAVNGGGTLSSAACPAGFRWVVLNVTAQVYAAGTGNLTVVVPGLFVLFQMPQTPVGNFLISVTHQVVNPGETIQAVSQGTTGTFSFAVTGWELSTA